MFRIEDSEGFSMRLAHNYLESNSQHTHADSNSPSQEVPARGAD